MIHIKSEAYNNISFYNVKKRLLVSSKVLCVLCFHYKNVCYQIERAFNNEIIFTKNETSHIIQSHFLLLVHLKIHF